MLRKSGPARALDSCHRSEGSWALGTRMGLWKLIIPERLPELRVLVLTKRHVGSGNEIAQKTESVSPRINRTIVPDGLNIREETF